MSRKFRRIRQGALPLAVMMAAASNVQAGPTITYGEQGFVTLNYSVQMWGQYQDYTSNTDSGETTDLFLRRNRITLSGQYNDYVGFYAQLEAGNDSKEGNDDKNVFYRDAYLTLDWSDSLRFIAGRFKNTFTRENLEACLEPLTLDRAEVLSYTPFGGTRDTGVAMWGNLADAQFQYRVMVSDGREGDEVVEDSPRLTARAHWTFWDPEYDYGYRGTYLGTRKVLTIGAAYDMQNDVAYADYTNRDDARDYEAWTVDAFMEYPTAQGTVTASAAYMDYSVDNAINEDPDPALSPNSELDGYYAKAGYLLPNKVGVGRLQLFARYEDLDYGADSGYYSNTWKSVGANYYINGQQLKVTFEYANVDYDREHPTIQSLRDHDQVTLGLQLIF
ncbi:MAG TPA: selenite/tellurite reduction operon porin ExtI [Thiohalobacter sp.]|nr:selenite/tellurite reduction operon porin ExtI [Thiohalobacter sp.]